MGIEGLKVSEINSKVSPYWSVSVVEETGSTQIDCVADFKPGKVLVAEFQSAGRGRLDRKFLVPARKGLTFSICIKEPVNIGWIPLIAGIACANAINRYIKRDIVEIKWPNDLLIENRKLAGILSEKVEQGVVVGIGINISQSQSELPISDAVSLAMFSTVDRSLLLVEILNELANALENLEQSKVEYIANCATIGKRVLVTLPNGQQIQGLVDGISENGALLIADQEINAGDILHLR